MAKKRVLTILAATTLIALAFTIYSNLHAPTLGVTKGKFQPLSSRPNGVSTQATDPGKLVDPFPFKADTAQTMQAFRDDAEFWLDESKREVQFRSQSRLGYSDMGLNRARYEALRKSYLEN